MSIMREKEKENIRQRYKKVRPHQSLGDRRSRAWCRTAAPSMLSWGQTFMYDKKCGGFYLHSELLFTLPSSGITQGQSFLPCKLRGKKNNKQTDPKPQQKAKLNLLKQWEESYQLSYTGEQTLTQRKSLKINYTIYGSICLPQQEDRFKRGEKNIYKPVYKCTNEQNVPIRCEKAPTVLQENNINLVIPLWSLKKKQTKKKHNF